MNIYRYDPHVHTSETSKCGWVTAALTVDRYHRNGYAGIVITDHLHRGYIESLDCRDDWQDCVTHYLSGYRAACEQTKKYDMDVILGAELRFPENNNDYLVYGIDEAWLRDNPYMTELDHQAFFDRFGNDVLIIHAHPFRNGNDVVYHECVHGVEVVNCNPRHENHNERALELCRQFPRLSYRTCGSDAHRDGDEARAAVCFHERLRDSYAFKAAVEAGNFTLECAEYAALLKENDQLTEEWKHGNQI